MWSAAGTRHRARSRSTARLKWLCFPSRGAGKPVESETVYIPREGAACALRLLQVDCSLTCSFCHTGTRVMVRNLTAEIVSPGGRRPRAPRRLPHERQDRRHPPLRKGPPRHQRGDDGHGRTADELRAVRDAVRSSPTATACRCRAAAITLIDLRRRADDPADQRRHRRHAGDLALHAVRDDLRDVLVPISKSTRSRSCSGLRTISLSNARRITFDT